MTLGPMDGGVHLLLSDRLALTAAYDLLFLQARSCRDPLLREMVTQLTPGRAAVAGISALAGILGFLDGEREGYVAEQCAGLILSVATASAEYPDVP